MKSEFNRRQFIAATTAAGAALTLTGAAGETGKPAKLGGKPVRTKSFPSWPNVGAAEEKGVLGAVRAGRWNNNVAVARFEENYAKMNDAKYCVATSSGTTALLSSLGALGVGPGDEVVLPPYTFMATLTVILFNYAMPVFVDSDPETFLMDPQKLDAAITDRTAAVIPVHIGGSPCDLDSILAIAKKRNVPVIEDACQAHLASWRNRNVGTFGATGCFSFQMSKNLPSGEGGAILSNDETIAKNCFAFHDCGRKRPSDDSDFVYNCGRNSNLRMTELQGELLLAQMRGLAERADTRSQNADYLTKMLGEIPGIAPAKMYEGCTRNAYHLYMFRYKKEEFAGLPRDKFLSALSAEGIPCGRGYDRLNEAKFLHDALNSRPYVRVYGKSAIDAWTERNRCPENDKLCDESVFLSQSLLLGSRSDMDDIAAAVRKIQVHAPELAKR